VRAVLLQGSEPVKRSIYLPPGRVKVASVLMWNTAGCPVGAAPTQQTVRMFRCGFCAHDS